MENNNKIIWCAVLLLTALGMSSANGQAVTTGNAQELEVPLFKSRIVQLSASPARISIGNPDIADILILRSDQVYVLGKDLGTTNVLMWDTSDRLIGNIDISVVHDLDDLKAKLYEVLPAESIEVRSVQRSIILSGTVSSVSAVDAAVRIADAYLAQIQTAVESGQFEQSSASRRDDKSVGEIVNLLTVGGAQQVMLDVTVAEVARSEVKRMETRFQAFNIGGRRFQLGGVNGGASFPDVVFEDGLRAPLPIPGLNPLPPAIDEFAANTPFITDSGLFAGFLTDNFALQAQLDAAKENGLARILAEPTLVALSGERGHFLSGGEFPIPVPRGDDGVTIEFKEFGVQLTFLPVVLGADQINLKLGVAVSELVAPNSVGLTVDGVTTAFVIPSLSVRSADSTIELKNGQTIAIAGLISESTREIVDRFPGLGDIPILGSLFKSNSFAKGETELLILVTPHLAKPLNPQDIRLPTDGYIEPSDLEFYLLGKVSARPESSVTSEADASTTN
ncbi:MAG: type II and III secretion system protein family protein [Woeseiaceae bacterium]|nr:type II and III secretion system protein family protein [Woeseiaceae bacterium]